MFAQHLRYFLSDVGILYIIYLHCSLNFSHLPSIIFRWESRVSKVIDWFWAYSVFAKSRSSRSYGPRKADWKLNVYVRKAQNVYLFYIWGKTGSIKIEKDGYFLFVCKAIAIFNFFKYLKMFSSFSYFLLQNLLMKVNKIWKEDSIWDTGY